jgi:signal transduction histidine kinase/ActR/RegA family two-component response regulator
VDAQGRTHDLLAAQARIAALVAEPRALADVFGDFADAFSVLIPWDGIALIGPPGDSGESEVLGAAGILSHRLGAGQRIPLAQTGASVLDERPTVHGPYHSTVPGMHLADYRSALHIPLRSEGVLQGFLNLGSRKGDAYGPEEVKRAETVAPLLATCLAIHSTIRRLESSETQHRELYQELSSTHRRLLHAEKMASVGQLAAGVAHEINNPAAAVMSNLTHLAEAIPRISRALASYREALRLADPSASARLARAETADQIPTEEAEALEVIEESLSAMKRIRDIVRNLMRFSRTPGSPGQPTDLRDVVERALVVAQNEIRHRARLVRDYRRVPPVLGDAVELEQALVALLLNAAQAIPEGETREHEIVVRIDADDNWVRLSVVDDGVGIPPEVMPRIFDPFFTTKPVGSGTGLGLSLADDIVKKHGGEIDVESVPGAGTTARLRLPPWRAPAAPPPEAAAAPAERARVLIVDDEAGVLRAAERALRKDYDVALASSGEEAMELLARGPAPDVVLCDLMMPKMNGVELYQLATNAHPEIEPRFVFFTGGAFTPRAQALAARMAGRIVEKPLDAPELRAAIARHLTRLRG